MGTVINGVIAIHPNQLRTILEDAMKLAKLDKGVNEGTECPFISQHQAYKVYGKPNIERWLEQGLIKRYRDYGLNMKTSPYRYDVRELIKVSLSSNLMKDLTEVEKEAYRNAIKM